MQHPIEEAKALIAKGAHAEAIEKIANFLNTDFYNEEALFLIGASLMTEGKAGLGAILTSAAIDARAVKGQRYPEAMGNLGWAYKAEGHRETALKIWLDTLECETLPTERSKYLSNIGSLFINTGCPEKAIPWFEKAIEEDPNNWSAYANRGMAYLEMGRWREGWAGFSYTYLTNDRHRRNYKGLPTWDGSPGKRVIVFGDQGVGDEIYFASCLPDLVERCKPCKVVLDCHPRLEHLFRRSFPDVEVHGTRKHISDLDWLPTCEADAVIGLADLPRFFRNDGEWDGKPYLRAKATLHGLFNELEHNRGMRIGLSWTGGTKGTHKEWRSVSLDMLAPIIRAQPDAQFFSLQYSPPDGTDSGRAAREVCDLEERTGLRISHFPGWVECFDYDRTASFIGSLDLVISVCTTVHHCAGALGVPVWTMVPSKPSWRYGISGERLPWYGSARLYRQSGNDWAGLIEQIADDLPGCGL